MPVPQPEAHQILREHRLTIGQVLNDGTFAVHRRRRGDYRCGRQAAAGKSASRPAFSRRHGSIGFYPDRDGLWLNGAQGLSRVLLLLPNSATSTADRRSEAPSSTWCAIWASLTAGTTQGVVTGSILPAPAGVPSGGYREPPICRARRWYEWAAEREKSGVRNLERAVRDRARHGPAADYAHRRAPTFRLPAWRFSKPPRQPHFRGSRNTVWCFYLFLTGGNVQDEGNFLNLPKGKRVDRIVARADPPHLAGHGSPTACSGWMRNRSMPAAFPRETPAWSTNTISAPPTARVSKFSSLAANCCSPRRYLAYLFRLNEARYLYPFTPLDNGRSVFPAAPDPNVRGHSVFRKTAGPMSGRTGNCTGSFLPGAAKPMRRPDSPLRTRPVLES